MKNHILTILIITSCFAHLNGFDQQDEDEDASMNGGKSPTAMNIDPCYDRLTGLAQRCIPNFENVAYNRRVVASSTCGSPPINYCIQNGNKPASSSSSSFNNGKHCDKCDAKVSGSTREAKYLTDLEETNTTCWVSGAVYEPAQISNLTLDISFGKKYELTYIRCVKISTMVNFWQIINRNATKCRVDTTQNFNQYKF